MLGPGFRICGTSLGPKWADLKKPPLRMAWGLSLVHVKLETCKDMALFHLSLEPVMQAAAKLFKARWYKHACVQKSGRGLVQLLQITD